MRARPRRMDEVLVWLRANKHDTAPLTGTDVRALLAIGQCWQLYATTRAPRVLNAVCALLQMMQPKCWPLAKAAIPWAMDWTDEAPIWSKVIDYLDMDGVELPREALS